MSWWNLILVAGMAYNHLCTRAGGFSVLQTPCHLGEDHWLPQHDKDSNGLRLPNAASSQALRIPVKTGRLPYVTTGRDKSHSCIVFHTWALRCWWLCNFYNPIPEPARSQLLPTNDKPCPIYHADFSVHMPVFNYHYERVIKLKCHYNMLWGWDLQSNCKSPDGKTALSLCELSYWTVVILYHCPLSRLMCLILFVTDLPGYVHAPG